MPTTPTESDSLMVPRNNLISLTMDLCQIQTGIVVDGNEKLLRRIGDEIDLEPFSFRSGSEHNRMPVLDIAENTISTSSTSFDTNGFQRAGIGENAEFPFSKAPPSKCHQRPAP